ncbi:hypothetical protein AVEN_217159-1 [Araneus ventricosus]|uniref:Protein MIS12 homolog n=1 Tax=Araneus ventricosus TaxID=182803 RepID=A0A4Y2GLL4_ARAVE|nr:hypothetical protein AVEN_217159-1 [Araneus ventricosus]
MDFEAVMALDYETQHLGFHPRTFLDRVYNAFYESLFEALNELKKHLCNEYSHIVPVSSILSSTDELFQELIKKLDKAIDKLEIYIDKNIFMIPNHVILKEDEIHLTNPATKEEDEELDKEIEQIKQGILEERIRKNILKAKLKEQKVVKEELVTFKNKLSDIKAIVCQVKGTQEDLQLTLEKCWGIWNSLKQPPQMK